MNASKPQTAQKPMTGATVTYLAEMAGVAVQAVLEAVKDLDGPFAAKRLAEAEAVKAAAPTKAQLDEVAGVLIQMDDCFLQLEAIMRTVSLAASGLSYEGLDVRESAAAIAMTAERAIATRNELYELWRRAHDLSRAMRDAS